MSHHRLLYVLVGIEEEMHNREGFRESRKELEGRRSLVNLRLA